LAFPFLGDSFALNDLYSSGYPVASQPPVILLQMARPAESAAHQDIAESGPSPAAQPLMIELQNGHYVRVSSNAIDGEAQPLSFASTSNSASKSPTLSPQQNLPPAVLIFHDGHTEEVRDYTIADGTLYAHGDYYTDGYWNKKIFLSALNIAETLQANTTRNVKFVLPSSPNEVITRP
jgi:hypothetical protein